MEANSFYHKVRYQILRNSNWKVAVSTFLYKLGYQISRLDPIDRSASLVEDPYHDKREMFAFAKIQQPLIFDVGGNTGQSIRTYRENFSSSPIRSFEPLPKAYKMMRSAAIADGNTVPENLALDSSVGEKSFFSNRGGANQTSSFFEPGELAKHCFDPSGLELEEVIQVKTNTLDQYCADKGIDRIDLLKLDTQGNELEIMRGAKGLLSRKGVTMVYCEVMFTECYKSSPLYHDIASFMAEHGLVLFRIYFISRGAGGRDVCGDALFVERDFLLKYLDQFTTAH